MEKGNFQISAQNILDCLSCIHNPTTDSFTRRSADDYLMKCEKDPVTMLTLLLELLESGSIGDQLRFQVILLFGNVVKRTWSLRRLKEAHSAYELLKKDIRTKLLLWAYKAPLMFMYTYFDIIKFIAKVDFPHNYPEFSQLALKLIEEMAIDESTVAKFKELREIFLEMANRKGSVSLKLFEESLLPVLEKLCVGSSYFDSQLQSALDAKGLNSTAVKLSKYLDQIIISVLRMGPVQLLDREQILYIVKQAHAKTDHLLAMHRGALQTRDKALLEKNIKSLVLDLSSLQLHSPFMLAPILEDYIQTLSQVIAEPKEFAKSATLKYAMIAFRKLIREFGFYSPDELFLSAISSKPKSANFLDLRQRCHSIYVNSFSPATIQGLLNHLLASVMGNFGKNEQMYFEVDESLMVDRGQEKELSVEACVVLLAESILERFCEQGLSLIAGMIQSVYSSNFQNVAPLILGNLLGMLAILPRASGKKAQSAEVLNSIPILQILGFVYGEAAFKSRLPSIVSGWLDCFSDEQLVSLVDILLEFISGEQEDSLVLHSCQSLDRVLARKKQILAVPQIVKKVFPVASHIFRKTERPELLWPMVSLLSNVITECDFDSQIILDSFSSNTFSALVASQSPLLVEALSDMFRNFLCAIPRNCQAQTVYRLICLFLDNHLGKVNAAINDKVLNLWYVLVREYSPVQNCCEELTDLYKTHYRGSLFLKTPTLIYILQEYLLLGLVDTEIQEMGLLTYQFYVEAFELPKAEKEALKIAALSFQITLVTQYGLNQVNDVQMLKTILSDFYSSDLESVSATVRNSLLAIVNRYIILHMDDFFGFLSNQGLAIDSFFEVYIHSMQYLTSESAKKINSIAALLVLPKLPQQILLSKLHIILMTVIPSVEIFLSTLQQNGPSTSPFVGKVVNSPSLRFASNILSERKEQIRKKGMFEQYNLHDLFKTEFGSVCSRLGAEPRVIAENFPQPGWENRLFALLQ